jgi:hypothetical protein
VWEGKDNYVSRLNMKVAIDKARGEDGPSQFDLPEWDRFLNLVRSFLDAPDALTHLSFLSKEIAFREVTGARSDPDEHLRNLFGSNPRARQFIFMTAAYLAAAGKLPKEFASQLEATVNALVTPGFLPGIVTG